MNTFSTVYTTDNNRYKQYEMNSPSKYTRKCIDGKITGCGNCVGYCQYNKHPGFLTDELRQVHNCIGKGCDYYIAKPKRANNSQPKF